MDVIDQTGSEKDTSFILKGLCWNVKCEDEKNSIVFTVNLRFFYRAAVLHFTLLRYNTACNKEK